MITKAPHVTKGPYLLGPSWAQLFICWESDAYALSEVELKATDGTMHLLTARPRRRRAPWDLRARFSGVSGRWLHAVAVPESCRRAPCDYRIRAGEAQPWHKLKAAPAIGLPFSFCAYGDCGGGMDAHRSVAAAVAAEDASLMVHLGDMVLAGNSEREWEAFFSTAAYLPRLPLVPTAGNHDFRGGTPEFFNFFKPFFDDREAPPCTTVCRYGGLCLFVLNCMLEYERGSSARRYLEQAVRTASADPTLSWRFVLLHRPMFSWSNHRPRKYYPGDVKEELHRLFRDHAVHAVLSGHNHCYERFEKEGVTYLTLGGGGSPLYDPYTNKNENESALHRVSEQSHHFARVTVASDVADVRVLGIPGETQIDSFLITKSRR